MARTRTTTEKKSGTNTSPLMYAVVLLITGALVGGVVSTAIHSTPRETGARVQQSGDMGSQIKAYFDRVALNPKDKDAWIALGNLYFDADQPAQSVEAYSRALEIDPDNPNVLTDMGVMYRALGQYQNALDAFARAVAVDPGHETARFNTGIVRLYDLNDKIGAVEAWEGLARVNPRAVTPNGELVADLARKLRGETKPAPSAPPQAQPDSQPRLLR